MIDPFSGTWIAVRDELRRQIETSADALETPGLEPGRSEYHRGRIKLARELLSIPENQSDPQ